MFSEFEAIVRDRYGHAKELKERTGKQIFGYLCSYVPEEIIYAAGAIPTRILTTEEAPTLSETLMQTYYCTFARSILHQGLAGQLDYMDGLVTAYSCATMRLAFENLQRSMGLPYTKFLYLPGIIDTPEAKNYYYKELVRFKKDLEDLFGRTISDDDLREAIAVYNENRSSISELFEGRKEAPPKISGREAYLLTLSSMLTDKADHTRLLKKLIREVPSRESLDVGASRVMLVGSPVDNVKLIDLIEKDIGAWVVADDTCTCTRYACGTTSVDQAGKDPLRALVERYLIARPPCPTKHSPTRWIQCKTCPFRDVACFDLKPDPKQELPKTLSFQTPERICRFRHALQLAINHKVEGVIAVEQKFCDPHGFDFHHVTQAFQHVGIPTLFLEIDNMVTVGQIKTRVQAFIEMLHPVDYMIDPEIRQGISL
ncbi:MAG: 2-hydroxyacyl-CoA dehydratase family protein [Desulfatiglans sp.]|jgi:benzoyl-CoA reductase subunit C|nr:2-hydroxyacyl-CoA dehydratase family protein [Thermodesulfobacteriota bacterium]MEE4351560.1 2-hydroxyacyl-CoA dehydratase family protein [Desulfatiglans sp.]